MIGRPGVIEQSQDDTISKVSLCRFGSACSTAPAFDRTPDWAADVVSPERLPRALLWWASVDGPGWVFQRSLAVSRSASNRRFFFSEGRGGWGLDLRAWHVGEIKPQSDRFHGPN